MGRNKPFKKVVRNPEKLDPNMKLRILQIPQCNDRVAREVATRNDRNISEVEGIMLFVGKYIGARIKEGIMESVRLPAFGIFAPNIKLLQSIVKRKRMIANKTFLFELARKGKNINFVPQINPIDYGNIEERGE